MQDLKWLQSDTLPHTGIHTFSQGSTALACTLGVRRLSGFMMYFDLSCREIIVAWEWWYNSQMRKPLFAGALLIAIAVAIIVRKVSRSHGLISERFRVACLS